MKNEFTAIVEPAEEGGYSAYCLEVPGANGHGETMDEVIENLREGIEFMLEFLRDENSGAISSKAERRIVKVG